MNYEDMKHELRERFEKLKIGNPSPIKFDERVWVEQVETLIVEGLEKHVEIAAQLCKVDDKIVVGKKFYGTERWVSYPLEEMFKCEKGEWVGTIHTETLPHFPPFPSDEDIKNDFDLCRKRVITKPFISCTCSNALEPEPIDGKLPEKFKLLAGCHCEEWYPWTEEQHKEIVEKAMPYAPLIPRGWGYWNLRDDLKKLGHIKNQQRQWIEVPFEHGKFLEEKILRYHKSL